MLATLLFALIYQSGAMHEILGPNRTSPIDFSPNFNTSIQNVTAAVGREAILTCTVNDLGHYKVGWMKADDQTILSLHTRVITHNPRISITHDGNFRTWQLRIRQLKETDRGCYMCQINTNSMKKQLGCIDVQVPPDIDDTETSTDVTVLEGENVTLSCKASGHPLPRIFWKREDGNQLMLHLRLHETEKVDLYSGSQLGLYRVERQQMGAYLCIANNDVPPAVSKRIVLHINFAPVINVPNQLVGTPLNRDVQIECHVEAFPNTIHYWIKNKEVVMNSKKHLVSEKTQGYKVYMTLIVKNTLKRDIGTYVCVATNSLGNANGTIRLYEIKLQTQPPTTTTTKLTTTAIRETETTTITYPTTTTTTRPTIGTTSAKIPIVDEQLINNYIPSVEPAPLETMLVGKSNFMSGNDVLNLSALIVLFYNYR